MARRDVDLVIKARDQAASVVDSITKALNQFIDAQKNLDVRADKTESTLTNLGTTLGKLNAALKGLDAGDTLAKEMQLSTDSLARMEKRLESSQTEVDKLAKRLDQATFSQERYTGKLERNLVAQQKQQAVVAKAKVDQQQLTAAYDEAASAQERIQRRQAKLPTLIDKASVAAEKAAKNFAQLSDQVRGTDQPTASLVGRLNRAEQAVKDTAGKLSTLRTEFAEIGGQLNVAGAAMTLFGGRAEQAGDRLRRQESILSNMADNYGRIKASTAAMSQQQGRLASELRKAESGLQRETDELVQARGAMEKLGGSTVEVQQNLSRLAGQGFAVLVKATQDQRRAMLETNKAYRDAREESTRLGAALANTKKPSAEMVAAFADAAAETKRLKQSLLDQRQALTQMNGVLENSEQGYKGLKNAQIDFLGIVERLHQSLAEGAVQAKKEAAAIVELRTASTGAGSGTKTLTNSTRGLADASGRAAVATGALASAYRQFYGDTRRSLGLLQRIRGEVLSLVAAYGGLYGAITALKQVVEATQTLEAAQARLNVAFNNNPTRVAAEMDFLRRTSDRLGVSLGALATEYSKFNIATQGTSLEGDKARRIFVQIAEAARVNRSSTEELSGVFVALTQIVSKGAVQMEELRQQLGDRLPGAIQLMADGLGVGTTELIKMMEQGQVTEEALVGFADEVSKRFGGGLDEALLGITVAFGRLKNAAFQAAAEFGSGGFIKALTDFANKLTDVLRSADFKVFSRRVSAALGSVVQFLGFLAENFQTVIPIIVALISVRLVPIVLALGKAFTMVTGSATRAGIAFSTLQARANAMGVSITRLGYIVRNLTRIWKGFLASTGVGFAFVAITTAISEWSTQANRATKALELHKEIVDKVRNAYDEAEGAAEDWANVITGVTEQQAVANLQRLQAALQAARRDAIRFPLAIENMFEQTIGGTEESRRKIKEWTEEFRSGQIDVVTMKRRLEDLARVDPTLEIDDFIVPFQDGLDAVIPFEEAVDEAGLTLQALTGSADEAQDAMDALNGAMKPETASRMSDAMGKVSDAMQALDDMLPSAKAGMDDVAQAAVDMQVAYEEALRAARALPDAIMRIAAEQALVTQNAERLAELNARALDFATAPGNSLVDRIIGVESGGNPNARNPNSTATGLGQFIESTWLRLFKENFPDRAAGMTDAMILALREDAAMSREMVQLYIRENARILQAQGVALTDANLYLAHFLGPQGAINLIQSAPGTVANNVLSSGQVNANSSILDGKTREEVIAWAQRKVGISETELDILEDINDTERDRAEATADTIADNEFEIEQQRRINEGKEREAAIEEAIRDARADNPGISDEELDRIRQQAGELYDLGQAETAATDAQKDATEAARDASQQVNSLLEKRRALVASLNEALRNGDVEAQQEIRAALEGVTSELDEAIAKAREMWEAIGGPDAETALARLDAAAIRSDTLSSSAEKVYLQWDRVADLFVTGLAGAFDSFAEAVANGENAFAAARRAFLQFASDFLLEIAQMIIKQAIFNALQAAFGGTAFGSLIGLGTGHTGGLVGGSRVGSGNSSRMINPIAFAGAMRYHTGGIAGLRPGEVPIIAKQGEEIITKDDPRHMLNGAGQGGQGGTPPSQDTTIYNLVESEAVMKAALASDKGGRVLINFIRANAETVRSVLNG